jgi:hypothetical protein
MGEQTKPNATFLLLLFRGLGFHGFGSRFCFGWLEKLDDSENGKDEFQPMEPWIWNTIIIYKPND